MTFQLRKLRKQYGLSQSQISEFLDVSQATVSRLERGEEEISAPLRGRLIDFISNRTGVFDRAVDDLVRRSSVSVWDHWRLLHVTDPLARGVGVNPGDVVGREYHEMHDSDWIKTIFGSESEDDLVAIEYIYELVGKGHLEGAIETKTLRVKDFRMRMAGCPNFGICVVSVEPQPHETMLVSKTTIQDFDWS